MSAISNDMLDLIRIFNSNSVEYLVVGGHAVNAYTEPRATKDIDIWVNPSIENAKRVFNSLKEFGAPLSGMSEEDFSDEESFFIVGIKPNRIDVLLKIPGVDFANSYANKNIFKISVIEASFISLGDLIVAKETAGRPQDLVDAQKLKKIRDR